MKKMITTISFLLLGANSFAFENQSNESLIVEGRGYGFQCFGFCSGHQEDSKVVAKKSADLHANRECLDQGFDAAVLINEYQCSSYTESFGNIETTTYCNGMYRCEQ